MPSRAQATVNTTSMPTTSKPPRVFVDTCAFVALQDKQDSTHNQATHINNLLSEKHAQLYTSSDVVGETLTVTSKKLGKIQAAKFLADYLTTNIRQLFITPYLHQEAKKIFFLLASKHISFIDCTSIAAMKQAKISLAFTFDYHFEQAGLRLTSSLLK